MGAWVVARDAREARVDDVADAGDRDGRLRDVGGEDDARCAGEGAERAALLGRGEARQKGDRLDVREAAAADRLGGGADVAFAGEEGEDVAGEGAGEAFLDGVRDGRIRHERIPVHAGRETPDSRDGVQDMLNPVEVGRHTATRSFRMFAANAGLDESDLAGTTSIPQPNRSSRSTTSAARFMSGL